jgi:RNA polymerase sigma factor (sigma-70 family)
MARKPIRKLTSEQADLAARSVGIAHQAARYRSRSIRCLSEDEVLDAALFGLTLAARGWKAEKGPFYPYAREVCNKEISKDICKRVENTCIFKLSICTCRQFILDEIEAEEDDMLVALVAAEEVEQLQRAILLLPPRSRRMIASILSGLTQKQIAGIWGCTRQTVRNIQRKIFGQLRELMEKFS